MIVKFHEGLSLEKWGALPLDKKILNIASELSRAKNWAKENDRSLKMQSIERILELIDLTVESDSKELSDAALRELLRLREAIAAVYLETDIDLEELLASQKNLLDLSAATHNLQLEI